MGNYIAPSPLTPHPTPYPLPPTHYPLPPHLRESETRYSICNQLLTKEILIINYHSCPVKFNKYSKSWAVASIIACEMAKALNMEGNWRPFELLWRHPGLRNNYDGALNTNKNVYEIAAKIREILKSTEY